MRASVAFALALVALVGLTDASITKATASEGVFSHFEYFDGTEVIINVDGDVEGGLHYSYAVVPGRVEVLDTLNLDIDTSACIAQLNLDESALDFAPEDPQTTSETKYPIDYIVFPGEDQPEAEQEGSSSSSSSSSSRKGLHHRHGHNHQSKTMVSVSGLNFHTIKMRRSDDAEESFDDQWLMDMTDAGMLRFSGDYNESLVAFGCSPAGVPVTVNNIPHIGLYTVLVVAWDTNSTTEAYPVPFYDVTVSMRNQDGYLPLDFYTLFNNALLLQLSYVVAYMVWAIVMLRNRQHIMGVHRFMGLILLTSFVALISAHMFCAEWNQTGYAPSSFFFLWQVGLAAKRSLLWGVLLFLAQGFIRSRYEATEGPIKRATFLYFLACTLVTVMYLKLQGQELHHLSCAAIAFTMAVFVSLFLWFRFVVFFICSLSNTMKFFRTTANAPMLRLYRSFFASMVLFLFGVIAIIIGGAYMSSHPDQFDWRFHHFTSALLYTLDFQLVVTILFLFSPCATLSSFVTEQYNELPAYTELPEMDAAEEKKALLAKLGGAKTGF